MVSIEIGFPIISVAVASLAAYPLILLAMAIAFIVTCAALFVWVVSSEARTRDARRLLRAFQGARR